MRTTGLLALCCSVVLAAGGLGCGGLESNTTEAAIAVPPPVEPPVIPPRNTSDPDPPRIGREESRGDGEEARTPSESTGRDTDDGRLACGYICRGLPGCSRPRADGLCGICDDREVIRSECRPMFRELELCLRRNHSCQDLEVAGLGQLALNCGFDPRIVESCIEAPAFKIEPSSLGGP